MGERRRRVRQKSFLRGCVYFNNRRNAFDCLIRDISAEGARITFSDAVSVPNVVDLYIPQKEQMLRARVQWRRGEEIGLAFADATISADGGTDGELAARIARLESEIGALRRALKQLKTKVEDGEDRDVA